MLRSSPALFLPFFFFFNDTATTEIYTLSLHDALPISAGGSASRGSPRGSEAAKRPVMPATYKGFKRDRKSTRLNSSHLVISYAVFCLKKKKEHRQSQVGHCGEETSTTKTNDLLDSLTC